MAKVETLVDDFTTRQPWWATSGTVNWVDGRLRVDAATDYPMAYTTPRYDLTDSAIFAEVEPAPAAASRQALITLRQSSGNELHLGVEGSPYALHCAVTVNGDRDLILSAYDPVAMRYLRLRHASSTVFWETAPAAAGPWTIRRQAPPPSWALDSVEVRLRAGNWGSLPGGAFAWFDNLNYPPPGVQTFTAGKRWAAAYAQGKPVASLWKAGARIGEWS